MLTAVAGIWLAVIATCALHTWKYQTRAEKQIQFMDRITDIVLEYIQAMNAPITELQIVEMAIEAHSETASLRHEDAKNVGVISYIMKKGKADQTRLNEYLDKVRPIMIRMMSLATKGQVMGFKNYKQCYNACTMLAWSHGQIGAVSGMIGSADLSWDNEAVQKTLDKVMTIKAHSIRENIEKHNVIFLEFVKLNYQSLLA